MPAARRIGLALACGLGLSACGPSPPPPGTPSLLLGTAAISDQAVVTWVDLPKDAPRDVTLAPGAQGGFHIWLLYRTTGIGGPVLLQRQVDRIDPDGTRRRVLTTEGAENVTPDDSGRFQLTTPLRNFMCPAPIGISVVDQTLEMTGRLTTLPAPGASSGTVLAEDHVRVIARCPGDALHAVCLSTCSG